MGLTVRSTGRGIGREETYIQRPRPEDKLIALAGNPNVGKSTIFNSLTGMRQHTGNWPGKTVSNARGYCRGQERGYVMVDLPGTYSLMADSPEEVLARDFICFGGADAVLVVCDATCLDRNMNLLLQTMETGRPVLLCVNLLDEAESKGIHIDLKTLEDKLGIPVIGTVARDKKSREKILSAMDRAFDIPVKREMANIPYPEPVEQALEALMPLAGEIEGLSPRFICLRLLLGEMDDRVGLELREAAREQREFLAQNGIDTDRLHDMLVSSLVKTGERLCQGAVENGEGGYGSRDRAIDRIVTSRIFGYPLMIVLLALVFYLTIKGANYPSQWLSTGLFKIYDGLLELLPSLGAPDWLTGIAVDGAYKTLAWVVSVMLPPMAIFFPLFTLLEDSGYLPRIAYNLDRPFCRCGSCGRQALTMAMGFGCNAAGVVGCRIINSRRERLLAIITNSLVPCNGRFPTLIALISMFLISGGGGNALLSALALTGLILLSVALTFISTKLLSMTLLKGESSAFVLELPPYRRPELGKVIVRSVMDRTLFVLGRAAAVAAPAGAVLWLLANIGIGGENVLALLSRDLEPLGRLLGMDGAILLAFILGFPANEIVLPIAVMIYSMSGSLTELGELTALRPLLEAQGWTAITALCVMLFSLCHWPCSTTCMTIKKETQSIKWTLVSFILPTVIGVTVCFCVANICRLFGFAV